MQETQIWFLVWEDPMEKEMATHPSILAWKILWTEEPGSRLQPERLQRIRYAWVTTHARAQILHAHYFSTQHNQIMLLFYRKCHKRKQRNGNDHMELSGEVETEGQENPCVLMRNLAPSPTCPILCVITRWGTKTAVSHSCWDSGNLSRNPE